jgi:beta-glucosidase
LSISTRADVSSTERLLFPPGFLWGAGTAAYQIEGASTVDGRTPSIWDTFCRVPGKVVNGDTGDVAVDHYHRADQDVALMSEIGLGAYRFSVSWPRVQPGGTGPANEPGLAFYDRLVDRLLGAGIDPVVTLYHWDLPQELEDAGGWPARDTAYRFADYTRLVVDRLGDRVKMWTTINEPWCAAFLGYASGMHAPGLTDPGASLRAAYHLLLAHGLSAQVLRSSIPAGVPLSLVLNLGAIRPATPTEEDLDAVRQTDGLINRIFLDPVLRGGVLPADVLANNAHLVDWDALRQPGDAEIIGTPVDVIGVNYYQPSVVGRGQGGRGASAWPGCDNVTHRRAPGELTDMHWPIDPTGLSELLLRLHADYDGVPLMITENGAAFADQLVNGAVEDTNRIAYLRDHLLAAHEALRAGVDLRGYFVWSLMDNFEWSFGYGKRFGIIHVDYETQLRTLKNSARWYGNVIAAGGVTT